MSGINERESVIELLRLYRTLPALWDVEHEDYSNQLIKKQQYEILLNKYRETNPNAYMQELKKKINAIRTNFRRELRRLREATADGRLETTNLYYFDELSFLKGVRRPTKTKLQELKERRDKKKKLYRIDKTKLYAKGQKRLQSEVIVPTIESETEQADIKEHPVRFTTSLNISNRILPDLEVETEQNLAKDDSVRVPIESMKQMPDNRYQHLSIHWSQKLSQMGNIQRIFAEKLINDVFFNGELGLLNFNTSITNLSPHQNLHII